jgi:hypothetical protein
MLITAFRCFLRRLSSLCEYDHGGFFFGAVHIMVLEAEPPISYCERLERHIRYTCGCISGGALAMFTVPVTINTTSETAKNSKHSFWNDVHKE